jgi:phosphatidate cytidylyltransferase
MHADRVEAAPLVGNLHMQMFGIEPDLHGGMIHPGVAGHIGERFLHHPVGGDLHLWPEAPLRQAMMGEADLDVCLFGVALPLVMVIESRHIFLKNIVYSFVGLIYISLPLALLVDLRTGFSEDSYQLSLTVPLLIIFSLWINDTMAYIVGSIIGKTPLSKVSPKKTWEGTTGGVVLTVVVICLLAYFTGRISVVHAGVMAALAAVFGTIGDLFESKLKRLAGVKDSGNIMPGHGGFLDRFDSLLFAAVVVWIYVGFFLK